MENAESNVEIDSIADLVVEVSEFVDPTNPIAELHTAELNKGVDPILVGAAEAMAVDPGLTLTSVRSSFLSMAKSPRASSL